MDFNRPCYFYNLTYFNETVGFLASVHVMDLMTLSFLQAHRSYNLVHVMDFLTLSFLQSHLF